MTCQSHISLQCIVEWKRFFCLTKGPSIYYVSKGTGWVQKMELLADIRYCIHAYIVGGSEKVQNFADVIYGWSPSKTQVCQWHLWEERHAGLMYHNFALGRFTLYTLHHWILAKKLEKVEQNIFSILVIFKVDVSRGRNFTSRCLIEILRVVLSKLQVPQCFRLLNLVW